jgi:hypothetical protein
MLSLAPNYEGDLIIKPGLVDRELATAMYDIRSISTVLLFLKILIFGTSDCSTFCCRVKGV